VINQTISAAINHLLAAETWAREKLLAHAGKTAVIRVAAFDFCFAVGASGLVEPVPVPAEPQLEVRLAPASLVAALRGEESALKSAEIRGDAEFAAAVLFLVKNLRWDFEEDLSRVVGDIASHRLVADAKSLLAWERDARGRLAVSVGEYLTQESESLVAPAAVDAFVADVDRLRDDAARLEKRMRQLVAAGGSGGGAGSKR
jgi:ubiquinone biosynthesis accessory factor UbiJ